jgi:hypothetical protein
MMIPYFSLVFYVVYYYSVGGSAHSLLSRIRLLGQKRMFYFLNILQSIIKLFGCGIVE